MWSIYKDSSRAFEQWEENHVAWYVDEDSKSSNTFSKVKFMHDGPIQVHFILPSISTSIEVKDGKFEVDVENKILDMTKKHYHGQFIEGFYKKDGLMYVIMGS